MDEPSSPYRPRRRAAGVDCGRLRQVRRTQEHAGARRRPTPSSARPRTSRSAAGRSSRRHQVVVTQPAKGTFKAFSSICTHQGCPVATVANGTINCDCHGSKYAIADGAVVDGPAPRPLPPKQITVSGDSITLT